MELQTIERAANDFINDFCYDHIDSSAINREEDNYEAGRNHALLDHGNDVFVAGAEWRINSVWHDARKDVPEEFIPILVERDDFTFSVNMVGGYMTSCPLHWVRWAYVIDLLPERKEVRNEY